MNKGDPTEKFVTSWRAAEELLSHLLLDGFCCLSITYRVLTAEIMSCLFTKQKQHCEHITKQEKSLLLTLILFARLLCLGMCCISLLARDDTWIRKLLGSGFVWWSGIFSFPYGIDSVQIFVMLVCCWWHTIWSAEFCVLWGLVLIHLSSLFAAPDGPPQDVQLEPISSQSIRVTWKVNTHSQEYRLWQYYGAFKEVPLTGLL